MLTDDEIIATQRRLSDLLLTPSAAEEAILLAYRAVFGPPPVDDWRLCLAALVDAALPHPSPVVVAPTARRDVLTPPAWPDVWEAL